MTLRKFWTQLHWLLGITAGSLLLLIGLSGAALSFREEVLDALNPGGRAVAAQDVPPATPDAQLQALASQRPGERVGTLMLYAEPGRATRIVMEPAPGQRRGETLYLDPYSGAILPPLQGATFFEVAESLHRWLLLPREPGRVVAGVLAISLLILSLSGLYLRWPRDWHSVRQWWHIDGKLSGRALLRRLHLVVGTACLVAYVPLTATGIFWAFDAVRDPVSAWMGEPRAPRPAAPRMAGENKAPGAKQGAGADRGGQADADAPPVSLNAAWNSFTRATVPRSWTEASIRLPATAKAPVQITWLPTAPAHERDRNRMTLKQASGEVTKDERLADKPAGAQVLAAIYPLHMGTLLGLPGRIAMMLAALLLPMFTITGWWLYLGRRRLEKQAKAKQLEKQRAKAALAAGGMATP